VPRDRLAPVAAPPRREDRLAKSDATPNDKAAPEETAREKAAREKGGRDKPAGDAGQKNGSRSNEAPRQPAHEPVGNPLMALLLGWLVPGGGHFYLGRRGRALAFFGIVISAVTVGLLLEGRLYSETSGGALAVLGTLSHFFIGALYLILKLVVGYEGDVLGAGFEYGTAFLVTAGLMNALLILDAWDISKGYKE